MKEILKIKNISKDYGIKGFKTNVLKNISLTVNEGDFISINNGSIWCRKDNIAKFNVYT